MPKEDVGNLSHAYGGGLLKYGALAALPMGTPEAEEFDFFLLAVLAFAVGELLADVDMTASLSSFMV